MCARRGLDWRPGALSSQLDIKSVPDKSRARKISRLPTANPRGFNWDSARLSTPGSRPPIRAQTARTCVYGHLEECNAQRLSTSSLRRRLRLTLDDPVRPPHHPTDNPIVSVQWA